MKCCQKSLQHIVIFLVYPDLVGFRFYCICLFPCLFVRFRLKMKRQWIISSWSSENFGKCDISPVSSKQDPSNLQGSLQAQQYKSWGYLSLWFKWGLSCGGGWILLWLRHHRSLSLPSRASLQTSGAPGAPHIVCHVTGSPCIFMYTLHGVETNLISWGAFKVTIQWTRTVYPAWG